MAKIEASVVVPAYNEEKRILPFLKKLHEFFRSKKSYEVIVVDDGSKDKTYSIVKNYSKKWRNLKIISYAPNKGKGFAVKKGVLSSRGKKVLFMDADGATPPEEISKFLPQLDRFEVVVGTRKKKESVIIKKQPITRQIASFFFNRIVNFLFGMNFSDYFCGMKGFRKEAGDKIFSSISTERWSFDVQIFILASKYKHRVKELPIVWENVSGSKLSVFRDVPKIFINLLDLKFKKCNR